MHPCPDLNSMDLCLFHFRIDTKGLVMCSLFSMQTCKKSCVSWQFDFQLFCLSVIYMHRIVTKATMAISRATVADDEDDDES